MRPMYTDSIQLTSGCVIQVEYSQNNGVVYLRSRAHLKSRRHRPRGPGGHLKIIPFCDWVIHRVESEVTAEADPFRVRGNDASRVWSCFLPGKRNVLPPKIMAADAYSTLNFIFCSIMIAAIDAVFLWCCNRWVTSLSCFICFVFGHWENVTMVFVTARGC